MRWGKGELEKFLKGMNDLNDKHGLSAVRIRLEKRSREGACYHGIKGSVRAVGKGFLYNF